MVDDERLNLGPVSELRNFLQSFAPQIPLTGGEIMMGLSRD
jgi:hypothetical protein